MIISDIVETYIDEHDITSSKGILVADSVLYKKISFTFHNHWDNYLKTAVFKCGNIIKNVVLTSDSSLYVSDNIYYIPHEVIKEPYFTVSVFGVLDDSIITSTPSIIKVFESGYDNGENPLPPTPTEYEQLASLAQETKHIAESVRNDADSGKLNGITPHIGANGNWFIGDTDTGISAKGDQGEKGERGYSGLLPLTTIPWSSDITIPANNDVNTITLEGVTTFTLGEPDPNYSSVWMFSIKQLDEVYNILLPEINWTLGIAPTFSANTTTGLVLYYVDGELRGDWNC